MSDAIFTPDLLRTDLSRVVHPLDDAPEPKLFRAEMGRIHMTIPVRTALLALRLYLACMVVLVGWHVLTGL